MKTNDLLALKIEAANEHEAVSISNLLEDVSLAASWITNKHTGACELEVLFELGYKEKIQGYIALVEGLLNISLKNSITVVENKDWLKENQESFQPFTVGDFYIYGSHILNPTPGSLHPLKVDAATAFGSGNHGSTKGCLLALTSLKQSTYGNILDLGCGSGILAIAASKLWPSAIVLASDLDEECVRVSQENCILNSCNHIKVLESEGFASDTLKASGPYNLIVANILASVLTILTAEIYEHLAANGHIILSGILNTQAQAIIETYTANGFKLEKEIPVEEWTTLIFKK
jgi:ribosomal protein L11 methyltransferase